MEINGLLELIHRKETRSWSGLRRVSIGKRCFILDLGRIGWALRLSCSSLAAYMLYPWIFRGSHTYEFGIVTCIDLLDLPLGVMRIRIAWVMIGADLQELILSVIWCDLFKGLDSTIGISETVLKDGMINIHSHTRILETLTSYQATSWSDHDLGLDSRSRRPWPILNKTTTNSPA